MILRYLFRKPKPAANPIHQIQLSFRFSTEKPTELDRIAKLINDHPFPAKPLLPLLRLHLTPPLLTPTFLESILTRLFSGHVNGYKAFELFLFSLRHPMLHPTPRAFNTALHILVRMREFDKGWELLETVQKESPSLITPKALSIVIAKYVKFRSFDETIEAFERAERCFFADREFGVEEFNVLIRAFCVEKKMMEARAVFRRMFSRFGLDSRTLNVLLLGFKETRHVLAMDLFYHDAVARGFKPDAISYNIRIDAYCKKGRISEALRILEEMTERNFTPTLETMTTLIQGASIVRNPALARRLFDGMVERNLIPDTTAYNALIGAFVRTKDLKSGMELMDEMEDQEIDHDDVTYYTMYWGLQKFRHAEDVCKLFKRMVEKNFIPKARTVVMLMKYFCESRRSDLGLELWDYMVEKGCCPHGHALDLLVTGLCCIGKVEKAFQCFRQVVERGRHPSERGFRVLEGFLLQCSEDEKLKELCEMLKKLQQVVPPTKGHALYSLASGNAIATAFFCYNSLILYQYSPMNSNTSDSVCSSRVALYREFSQCKVELARRRPCVCSQRELIRYTKQKYNTVTSYLISMITSR